MIPVCSFWGIAIITYFASGLLMAAYFGLTYDHKNGDNISEGYGVVCCLCPVLNSLLALFVIGKYILFCILWVFGNIAWEFTDFWKSVYDHIIGY